jgi:hypothetical protein
MDIITGKLQSLLNHNENQDDKIRQYINLAIESTVIRTTPNTTQTHPSREVTHQPINNNTTIEVQCESPSTIQTKKRPKNIASPKNTPGIHRSINTTMTRGGRGGASNRTTNRGNDNISTPPATPTRQGHQQKNFYEVLEEDDESVNSSSGGTATMEDDTLDANTDTQEESTPPRSTHTNYTTPTSNTTPKSTNAHTHNTSKAAGRHEK